MNNTTVLVDFCNETCVALNCSNQTLKTLKHSTNVEAVVIPVIFFALFVVGIIGNGCLLVYMIRRRRMASSPHSIYVTSLVVGDLLMVTVSMPFMSTIYTFESWPYGESVCKLSEFFHTLCTSETVCMLTALSIERYIIISCKHSKHQNTGAIIIVFIIWFYSFMFAIPDLITANLYGETGHQFCLVYRFTWGEAYAKTMTVQKLLFLFVIPVIVTILCYVVITIKLLFTSTTPSQSNSNKQTTSVEKNTRLLILIFTLIMVFVISWLPRRVFLMWFYFDTSPYNKYWHFLKQTGFCLMYANSTFNPLVFFALDPGFRKFVRSCNTSCCKQEYIPVNGVIQKSEQIIILTELTRINESGSLV